MRLILVITAAIIFVNSCKRNQIRLTKDYVYYSKGFSEGFTIKLLKVYDFDEDGLPKNYSDSFRIDLNYSKKGDIKKRIWFYRDNENYFWTYNLDSMYKTMPVRFEKGSWYGVWSGIFKSGKFKTDKHYFYLYKDSSGKVNIFERVQKLNL